MGKLTSDKLAIIGMGGVFPGAANPEDFWHALLEGKNLTKEFKILDHPEFARHRADDLKSFGLKSQNPSIRVGLTDPDLDLATLGIAAEEKASYDVLIRNTLEITRQTLTDAKLLDSTSTTIGLIMGNLGALTVSSQKTLTDLYSQIYEPSISKAFNQDIKIPREGQNLSPLNLATDSGPIIKAKAVFGLEGPCFAIDAACASSIYVFELARYYLMSGLADTMICGGISEVSVAGTAGLFSTFEVVAEDRTSSPLNQGSQAMVPAYGGGAFAVKLYHQAVEDGDDILGIVENIGLSNDGGVNHILAPDEAGQQRALEAAYLGEPPDIDYVECHATGTSLGDQVELNSLEKSFEKVAHPPLFGATKPNTGHLLTGSGAVSIIKVLKAMKANEIPATIGVDKPISSRNGSFGSNNLVREKCPWPLSPRGFKRGAINAFGFGGSNSHMVLREDTAAARQEFIRPQTAILSKEPQKLAVVGVGLQVGELLSMEDFSKVILDQSTNRVKAAAHRHFQIKEPTSILRKWGYNEQDVSGNFIDSIHIDHIATGISPKVKPGPMIADILLTRVANKAIAEAKLDESGLKNVAVLIASETDAVSHRFQEKMTGFIKVRTTLEAHRIKLSETQEKRLRQIMETTIFEDCTIDNSTAVLGCLQAARVTASRGFQGPSFKVSARENSIFVALKVAKFLLTENKVDAVVVGSVHLGGSLENIAASQLFKTTLAKNDLAKLKDMRIATDGAAALVLKRSEHAYDDNNKIYALIDKIEVKHFKSTAQPTVAAVISKQMESLSKDSPQLIEVAAGYGKNDLESQILKNSVTNATYTSLSKHFGLAGPLSPLLSLISILASMQRQTLPPGLHGDIPSKPAPWPPTPEGRTAAVSSLSLDGSHSLVILKECMKSHKNKLSKWSSDWLFIPVRATNRNSLSEKLQNLTVDLQNNCNPLYLSKNAIFEYKASIGKIGWHCVIIGRSVDDLIKASAELSASLAKEDKNYLRTSQGSVASEMASEVEKQALIHMGPLEFSGNLPLESLLANFPEVGKIWGATPSSYQNKDADFCRAYAYYYGLQQVLSKRFKVSLNAPMGSGSGVLLQRSTLGSSGENIGSIYKVYQSLRTESAQHGFNLYYIEGDISWISQQKNNVYIAHLVKKNTAIISANPNSQEFQQLLEKYLPIPLEKTSITATPCAARIITKYDNILKNKAAEALLNPASYCLDSLQTKPYEVVIDASPICLRTESTDAPNHLKFDHASISAAAMTSLMAELLMRGVSFDIETMLPSADRLRKKSLFSQVNATKKGDLTTAIEKELRTFGNHTADQNVSKNPADAPNKQATAAIENNNLVSTSMTEAKIEIPTGQREMAAKILAHGEQRALPQTTQKRRNTLFIEAYLDTMKSETSLMKAVLANQVEANIVMRQMMSELTTSGGNAHYVKRKQKKESRPAPLFNFQQIEEMTNGSMSKVLGPYYKEVDRYPIRTRMPSPPFLFVSRIMKINATPGELKPASIELEFDIPKTSVFAAKHQIESCPIVESSHIGIFLLAYLGVDKLFKGKARYRVTDSAVTFLSEPPLPGQTMRGVFCIESFLKEGDKMLIFYKYSGYIGDRKFLVIRGTGGLFTEKDLNQSKGIKVIKAPKGTQPSAFPFPYKAKRQSFSASDLNRLSAGQLFGDIFGQEHPGRNQAIKTPATPQLKMVDRIIDISCNGGSHHLGHITAEKDIDPNHWAFSAHFKNDPIFPGTVMTEGIGQILNFFMIYSGIFGSKGLAQDEALRLLPALNQKSVTSFRGQIPRRKIKLSYHVDITKVEAIPGDMVILHGDARIYYEQKCVLQTLNATCRAVRVKV